jgi:protein-ribulosamine 3-kinase
MSVWTHITEQICQATGTQFKPAAPSTAGGGCINQAFHLGDDSQSYFVKLNNASLLPMFEAEAAGLEEIRQSHCIRVPEPVCCGRYDGDSFLVLEHIPMSGGGDMGLAGRQLALMHRQFGDSFGWSRDNTIGSTHQPNDRSGDWVEFWQRQRLGHQLKLADELGHGGRLQESGSRLLQLLPELLGHQPRPSLLHGDLWGGNIAFDADRQPVIFDPAVYYGDREADLAMTELFGGFSREFYTAYNEVWPLDPGYAERRELYNLYHILNHLNIFGGGYAAQAQGMMDRLLARFVS